jgi:hypothetical protein
MSGAVVAISPWTRIDVAIRPGTKMVENEIPPGWLAANGEAPPCEPSLGST